MISRWRIFARSQIQLRAYPITLIGGARIFICGTYLQVPATRFHCLINFPYQTKFICNSDVIKTVRAIKSGV
ncbi:hypothetical protein CHELA17_61347 [Chelatococcus asaccharovorans]|nr:hypothetical protein CHELA17_61347 [Chelatococcus asaccharovorans]